MGIFTKLQIKTMTIKKSLLALSLGLGLITSGAIAAESKDAETISIEIPMVTDAQVFSKFNDKYPAMVNYFTKDSYSEITSFYSEQFGAPTSEQTVYGRLELNFEHMQQTIRVIVAKQKNHREVDVIIEENKVAENPAEK